MIDPDTGKGFTGIHPSNFDPNKDEPELTQTDSTETRFYPVWIHAPSGETKRVEIQSDSIENAFAKARMFYKTFDRILIDIQ